MPALLCRKPATRNLISLAVLALLSFGLHAEPASDKLDLSDCRVLAGKLQASAYKRVLADLKEGASAGDMSARKGLVAIANNKFACMLEEVSDGAGWTIISSADGQKGKAGAVTTSTSRPEVAAIMNNPKALQALREAYREAKGLADEEIPYRQLAAGYVADYREAFPDQIGEAYRYALGAQQIACSSPKLIGQKPNNFFCGRAKTLVAVLFPHLTAEKRSQEEQAAQTWATAFAEKAGNRRQSTP